MTRTINRRNTPSNYRSASAPNAGCSSFTRPPDAKELFHGDYAYFASVSKPIVEHFEGFAKAVTAEHIKGKDDPFVVEIGCNDGVMLQNFMRAGIRHLGIEPSTNVAQVAIDKGMTVTTDYFNQETAERARSTNGAANVILGANVIAHIADFPSVARGIKALLADDGVFICENAYLGEIIKTTAFDQFYDEHVFTYSALSVDRAFAKFGLELVDLQLQPVHGGSMRYTIAHAGARTPTDAVAKQIAWETEMHMDKPDGYIAFKDRCEKIRKDLVALLKQLKADGKSIAGFGATAKSTTVLNYCGIGNDLIDYIQDNTPSKIDKLTPGKAIPIRSPEYWHAHYPDYCVNFRLELCRKNRRL